MSPREPGKPSLHEHIKVMYSTQVVWGISDTSKTAGSCMGIFSLYSISDMDFQELFGIGLYGTNSVSGSVKKSRENKQVFSTTQCA